MICPHCADACQRSTVRQLRTWKLDPEAKPDRYFDEDGNEHSHDPRIVMTEFACSMGHRFAERSSWQCASCGYMACKAELVEAEPGPDPSAPTKNVRRTPGVPAHVAKKRKAKR
jgi:hypothetical protein